MVWSEVGDEYRRLFERVAAPAARPVRQEQLATIRA